MPMNNNQISDSFTRIPNIGAFSHHSKAEAKAGKIKQQQKRSKKFSLSFGVNTPSVITSCCRSQLPITILYHTTLDEFTYSPPRSRKSAATPDATIAETSAVRGSTGPSTTVARLSTLPDTSDHTGAFKHGFPGSMAVIF